MRGARRELGPRAVQRSEFKVQQAIENYRSPFENLRVNGVTVEIVAHSVRAELCQST
jgi:hypothetical protein